MSDDPQTPDDDDEKPGMRPETIYCAMLLGCGGWLFVGLCLVLLYRLAR
jgi:hypothetical protein